MRFMSFLGVKKHTNLIKLLKKQKKSSLRRAKKSGLIYATWAHTREVPHPLRGWVVNDAESILYFARP